MELLWIKYNYQIKQKKKCQRLLRLWQYRLSQRKVKT
nr:MAG TPA: hypothetical protein [Caudoviricetes sp.]